MGYMKDYYMNLQLLGYDPSSKNIPSYEKTKEMLAKPVLSAGYDPADAWDRHCDEELQATERCVLCEEFPVYEDFGLCRRCLCEGSPEDDSSYLSEERMYELKEQGYFTHPEERHPLDTGYEHGPEEYFDLYHGEDVFTELDLYIEIPF